MQNSFLRPTESFPAPDRARQARVQSGGEPFLAYLFLAVGIVLLTYATLALAFWPTAIG